MLTSQGIFLATAMAVSAGTMILFDIFREKIFSSSKISLNRDSSSDKNLILKSCLSSGSKKMEKELKKKKKVKFAEEVMKDSSSRMKDKRFFKKENTKSAEIQKVFCGKEIIGLKKMPANRVALYTAMLQDRAQRMESS